MSERQTSPLMLSLTVIATVALVVAFTLGYVAIFKHSDELGSAALLTLFISIVAGAGAITASDA